MAPTSRPDALPPAARGPSRAMVEADSIVTAYVRAGSGHPVLLLRGGRLEVNDDRLFVGLATRFRVLAPRSTSLAAIMAAVPDGHSPFTRWLSGFLEAMGGHRVSVVVDEAFGAAVQRFAELDPERLERIVVLGRPAGGAVRRAGCATPTLLVPDDVAVAALVELLSDGRPA